MPLPEQMIAIEIDNDILKLNKSFIFCGSAVIYW